MPLPPFDERGLLPPGDYPLTLQELEVSHLVTGEGNPSLTWDAPWRARLVGGLVILVRQLWQVGVERIFVDGSFVEDKDHPNDIDGYFECDVQRIASGELVRELNALDPHQVWTWSPVRRIWDPATRKGQMPMWHQYRVELYPHYPGLMSGGILDRWGNELTFPSAFRQTRTFEPRGIIQVVRDQEP